MRPVPLNRWPALGGFIGPILFVLHLLSQACFDPLNGPALRITLKRFKLLQISDLYDGLILLINHPFPFSAVYHHLAWFFLAIYWPLGKSVNCSLVTVSF